MLTPFGKAIRHIRVDKGLRLLDMAETLELSPAFVSAIETGRKPIPDGYVAKIIRALELSPEESKPLRSAADRTRKDVRVANLPENQRELVAAFSRRLDDVPEELLERLKDIILKSLATETPFHRKRRGLVVPPLSAAKLRKHAERIRSIILDDVEIEFPIIKVLEHVLPKVFEGFYLDVVDTEVMGDDEGRVLLGTPCLMLREDVYTGACRGVGRHRFTAAHELGHFLLHREVPMARARDTDMPIYRDSEWQADTFAGALFMSSRHLKWFEDSEDAAKKCGMSYAAAEYQWGLYEREGLVPGP